ncbi:Threonine/homoserine/homoserine lactone efflux protein [Streptoalloteichus tenebrarius]|uniref:Threonine/homoserine/homoserine lactone efflux protein n=1 Tax=Streptoalloteichus tenebrarius (strain ATCC 17920 / DSM 40477 / JCM 4838 / CBS 697.72 / NBRC 16177 / NCIMB 11028 / NRRL B-12390 / A12253. 1 / ISP 5477) TaxID=1933 RepID=A0ABT1HN61_STRSD|nr:LysE family translocator [Streptoalloteichus tenebrarius]MCP2256946.1 Threonine/homoserine/homoserine lactone efflux protein [Streptoalloteichus tenebrarius]BFF00142.1 LysE family translocator [Streptoalloteichus tenebrarius]
MTGAALTAYVVAALLMAVSPGLDTMFTLRSTALGGRRTGLAAVGGISLGSVTWGLASVVGLTALLRASQLAYDVIRYAGAAYLLWLGASALWRSWRDRGRAETASDAARGPRGGMRPLGAFRSGLTTNLLNPKVGVFYMSLLPQFLPTDGSGTTGWALLLIAIHVGAGATWLAGVTWLAAKARGLLARDRVKRWLDRAMATVLIGFGVRVALDGR